MIVMTLFDAAVVCICWISTHTSQMATSVDVDALRARYADAGQSHVFEYLDRGLLSANQQQAFLTQLASYDLPLVNILFNNTMGAAGISASNDLTPPTDVQSFVPARETSSDPSAVERAALTEAGMQAIAKGQMAALILAGGQGTRLGFDRPKGEYVVGLPSQQSLFALVVGRLRRLHQLAQKAYPSTGVPPIPLYIMTSPMTHEDTKAYLATHNYFGYSPTDVVLFSQAVLPALSLSGKILLESAGKVAEAPDGNGGIYRALHTQGVLADMQKRGVVGVHVFAVDNAIVKPCDPLFLGFCLTKGADIGSKVCPKTGPHEKVGVLCKRGGQYSVVEYSELDKERAEARDPVTGELLFNAGNLCIHYYSVDFLAKHCSPDTLPKVYHVAMKSIPIVDPATGSTMTKAQLTPLGNTGMKLESFIFDVFPAADKMAILQIDRESEFSPIKNAPGAKEDSPDTARSLVSSEHRRWLCSAGATITGDGLVEVSPLVSYNGEGLTALAGVTISSPLLVCKHEDLLSVAQTRSIGTGKEGKGASIALNIIVLQ
jgi:UDP-N-acetylglucosamine/UDP-N-acetylgalactosamine diphosphorylase